MNIVSFSQFMGPNFIIYCTKFYSMTIVVYTMMRKIKLLSLNYSDIKERKEKYLSSLANFLVQWYKFWIWNSPEIVKVYLQRGEEGGSLSLDSFPLVCLLISRPPGNLPRDQSPWKEAHAFLSRLFPPFPTPVQGTLPPFLISDLAEVKITIPPSPHGTGQNVFIQGKIFFGKIAIIIRVQVYRVLFLIPATRFKKRNINYLYS